MSEQLAPYPLEWRDLTFHQAIEQCFLNGHWPYWVRREKPNFEVCYHEEAGIVSPKVVARFSDQEEAYALASKLSADALQSLIAPLPALAAADACELPCMRWRGPGEEPPKWTTPCGVLKYRSREDAVDD